MLDNLKNNGLTQTIISDPDSIFYLLGYSYDPGERMLALYLNDEGDIKLINNNMFPFPEMNGLNIHLFDDTDDYVSILASVVKAGKLGIDKFFRAQFLIPLMDKRSDVTVHLGSLAVDEARKLKDAEELELMRKASLVNDIAMSEGIAHIGDNLSEKEMGNLINKIYMANGGTTEVEQIICYGPNTAEPHHRSDTTRIKEGDVVLIDIFSYIDHYCCDMTRTVFYKDITAEEEKIYNIVLEAYYAGIDAVELDKPLREVDNATRAVITSAGFGDYFTHRTGHGIGIALHEPPDVSSVTNDIIEPGMVFSVEPGIYLPGRFGIRIEDLVAVTEDGIEVLNKYPKDIMVIE
ncbi:MAG TPA: aminopeptidase P family protein [Clostridiaceae bacterium]|nr:aminopeptidase P family protein [Clostridiaceae bacterium]